MFQPTELNSIVSRSKLWDRKTVSEPAAYLQTLCTNTMPCFWVSVPIICRMHSLIQLPHLRPGDISTDIMVVNCELSSQRSSQLNQSQNLSLTAGFNNEIHTNKQRWSHYPKWDVKADKTFSFKLALTWILLLTGRMLSYPVQTCYQLASQSISLCRNQDSEPLW